MIEENNGVKEQKYVDVNIYGIPEGDWFYFKDIIKTFEGDRVRAFRALLDSYNREQLLGEIITKMDVLEDRISKLETKGREELFDKIKVHGGKLG